MAAGFQNDNEDNYRARFQTQQWDVPTLAILGESGAKFRGGFR